MFCLLDCLKVSGEDNNVKVMVVYLNYLGFEVYYVNLKEVGIFVFDEFGRVRVFLLFYEKLL